MINRNVLLNYLDKLLKPELFQDYCPNGLQVEGDFEINKIITGVSLSSELIDYSINVGANAIIVHHGIFWKNDDAILTGVLKKRIKLLLDHGINLYAYHLPLDNHGEIGNNVELAKLLGIDVIGQTDKQGLLWYGTLNIPQSLNLFKNKVSSLLLRDPLVFGLDDSLITSVAWCTGGADSLFKSAINMGVDLYITGEASEPVMHLVKESGTAFMAAGHYATERYGIRALTTNLIQHLNLDAEFIEIYNPV